jgi:hypothetical protein
MNPQIEKELALAVAFNKLADEYAGSAAALPVSYHSRQWYAKISRMRIVERDFYEARRYLAYIGVPMDVLIAVHTLCME